MSGIANHSSVMTTSGHRPPPKAWSKAVTHELSSFLDRCDVENDGSISAFTRTSCATTRRHVFIPNQIGILQPSAESSNDDLPIAILEFHGTCTPSSWYRERWATIRTHKPPLTSYIEVTRISAPGGFLRAPQLRAHDLRATGAQLSKVRMVFMWNETDLRYGRLCINSSHHRSQPSIHFRRHRDPR